MLERCCAAAASLGRVYSTDGSAGFGLSATVSTICKAADIWTAARPPAGGQRLGGLWLKVCCPAAARIGRRRGKGGLRQAALGGAGRRHDCAQSDRFGRGLRLLESRPSRKEGRKLPPDLSLHHSSLSFKFSPVSLPPRLQTPLSLLSRSSLMTGLPVKGHTLRRVNQLPSSQALELQSLPP